ncbi:multidrug ABC transporter ATP-binding protein [Thermogymnomonas acidicola]|uniref:Multidrug ABC transporter ATP-binding protein n=1 Tax=Thermogymnomonas acidicola TaxID=399579 RepID=A0AA37F9J8_9ARCH|nr:ABC transporter ATP-binding protein [Thermogymnomonas acidicola]GGM69873.1 multidrug ABC transporter ATP-binding protein [Thermogymnomonas acidicola]
MIKIIDLEKRYRDGPHALKGINLELEDGVTSIIGRNGAGKTTLIRILSTQLEPTSGTALINGLDILKDTQEVRRNVVSIPQESGPIGILTPVELVKLFLVGRGMSFHDAHVLALKTLDQLGLREFRNAPSDTLSGGMKRKIFVAMALAANVDTVFLDEPTTGLDPLSRIEVWSAVRELDGNVILTTHYMEEAQELSRKVVLIDNGTVLEKGTVQDLLSKFRGKIRVECSFDPGGPSMRIGNMFIGYAPRSEAESYIDRGCTVKAITLDDLFLAHGVLVEP